jgi:ubiquinone/menaquinone biosynthesis C-methylase UbiE
MLEKGQVVNSAAEVYEEYFLPALFSQWGGRVARAAGVQPGDRVLDVACGTGVLARAAADLTGQAHLVTGLDINEGMLAVAQRIAPQIDWRHGQAEALPFDSSSFDKVGCQFGLMFFEDRRAAIREMVRVLRPNGRMAAAVWDKLEHSPGYAAMTALLDRLFGKAAADSLRAPFALGDPQQLRELFSSAGLPDAQIATHAGKARFPSIQSWAYTNIKGWTLADRLDDDQFNLLCAEAEGDFQEFVTADGAIEFEAPAHIITAGKQ